jgi:hypothetical protein
MRRHHIPLKIKKLALKLAIIRKYLPLQKYGIHITRVSFQTAGLCFFCTRSSDDITKHGLNKQKRDVPIVMKTAVIPSHKLPRIHALAEDKDTAPVPRARRRPP